MADVTDLTAVADGITACVKWVDLRPEVDSLTGAVHHDERHFGFSAADESAVGVALRLGATWDVPVTVVSAAPVGAEPALRDLAARRIARVVRVEIDPSSDSATVAAALASHVDRGVVVCGDHSLDRGSGSVPAFLAHHLRVVQALGLSEVEAEADTSGRGGRRLTALRRLGGGRKERLEITAPAVLSVEAGVGHLPRAALAAVLASRTAAIEVRASHHVGDHRVAAHLGAAGGAADVIGPYRPRTRQLPAPGAPAAFDRIVELTGALVERTPPQRLDLEPAAAAAAILEAVRSWTSDD